MWSPSPVWIGFSPIDLGWGVHVMSDARAISRFPWGALHYPPNRHVTGARARTNWGPRSVQEDLLIDPKPIGKRVWTEIIKLRPANSGDEGELQYWKLWSGEEVEGRSESRSTREPKENASWSKLFEEIEGSRENLYLSPSPSPAGEENSARILR